MILKFLKNSVAFILLALLILAFLFFNIYAAGRNVRQDKIKFRDIEDGELEILSLHLAYSNRISKPKKRNNKVGFYLDKTWYYWAGGRILDDIDITNSSDYSPHLFYTYGKELPKLPEKNELNKLLMQEEYTRRRNQKPRNNNFFDKLYNAETINSIEKDIVLVRLLGFWVRVNKSIAPKLEVINKEVLALAEKDITVSNFLRSLKTVSGYVLKDIAKSQNVSYHSYGLAFDTLPKNNRKAVYWSWSRVNNKDWYAISYANRWSPPVSVIEIFEAHGFIWGGKWLFFDTIHFEYRPEIIHYNNLLTNREYALKLLSK